MRVYLMEQEFLRRLLDDRREIMNIAKSLGTAEAMRAARADLLASTRIQLTPKPGTDPSTLYTVDGAGMAHIDIVGELTPAAETDACGAYTAEALTEYGFIQAAARAAEADPKVKSIAFHADTPGGYEDGLDETAQIIARLSKPTTTFVHNLTASAGYWLASQTDKIVAMSPDAMVGSIGVAMDVYDTTAAEQAIGITRRTFTSTDAPNKRPDLSTKDGQAQVVQMLDSLHEVFVSRVASGRGVTPETVNKQFGAGALVIAGEALRVGMIDEVVGVNITRESTPGVAGTAARAAIQTQEVKGMELKDVTLEALTKERPELAAAMAEVGVKQERERVNALRRWTEADPDNGGLAEIVAEAIASGKSEDEVKPRLNVAIRNHRSGADGGENPPKVETAVPCNGAGVEESTVSDELRKRAAKAGITPEELAKYAPKGGK